MSVDLNHLYIDDSKFEANANKYSWVWKKATEKSRYRLFAKITALFEKMNNKLKYEGVKIQTNTEYTPKYLDEILSSYKMVCNIDESKFVYGKEVKLKSNWRFIWFQSALISTNFIQNKSDCKKLLEFSTLRCLGEGGVYSFLNNCLIFLQN